jgi:hypothetical protein
MKMIGKVFQKFESEDETDWTRNEQAENWTLVFNWVYNDCVKVEKNNNLSTFKKTLLHVALQQFSRQKVLLPMQWNTCKFYIFNNRCTIVGN